MLCLIFDIAYTGSHDREGVTHASYSRYPGFKPTFENRRFVTFLQAIQSNSVTVYQLRYTITDCFCILANSFLTNRPIIRRYVNWVNGSVLK